MGFFSKLISNINKPKQDRTSTCNVCGRTAEVVDVGLNYAFRRESVSYKCACGEAWTARFSNLANNTGTCDLCGRSATNVGGGKDHADWECECGETWSESFNGRYGG